MAHAEGIPVCEILRNIPIIGNGYVRTFLGQTYMVSVVFKKVWKQSYSRMLAAPDDRK